VPAGQERAVRRWLAAGAVLILLLLMPAAATPEAARRASSSGGRQRQGLSMDRPAASVQQQQQQQQQQRRRPAPPPLRSLRWLGTQPAGAEAHHVIAKFHQDANLSFVFKSRAEYFMQICLVCSTACALWCALCTTSA
jgi:hypothetical protein